MVHRADMFCPAQLRLQKQGLDAFDFCSLDDFDVSNDIVIAHVENRVHATL